jgi:hypothetical protein
MIRGGLLAVLAVWLGPGGPAWAGVYHTGQQIGLPRLDKVRYDAGQVRAIRTVRGAPPAPPGSLRWQFERKAAELEAQERAGALSTLDRVDLGACYIRMGRDQDAIRVLEAGDRKHFLILANLATAYHGIGQFDRAIAYQRQALDAWPAVWAGWTEAQLQHYRRVDRYYLTLLQLRYREQLRAGGRPVRVTTVDELFPKVRFVGPSGQYEAGALAQASRDEVPVDATLIALQLVVWLPFDDRLYWLLGELLNASGNVQYAYDVFDELVYARRVDTRELAQHRQVLRDAVLAYKAWGEPGTRLALLWALSPPAAGSLTQAGAPFAAQFKPQLAAGPALRPGGDSAVETPPPPPPNWLPDWRPLAVGFGAGVVVALLGALQWREWRRKRPAPAPAHAGAFGHARPAEGADGVREASPGERGASAP